MNFNRLAALLLIPAAAAFAVPAAAQDNEVPYWASIRASEVNMRVGPGEDYRITWVYRRPDLPLKVLRLKEGWRFVQDPDGARGWMLARFLKRDRGAIVRGKGVAEMREAGSDDARLLWRVEPGVVAALGDCSAGWCAVTIGAHRGFIAADRIWGDGEP